MQQEVLEKTKINILYPFFGCVHDPLEEFRTANTNKREYLVGNLLVEIFVKEPELSPTYDFMVSNGAFVNLKGTLQRPQIKASLEREIPVLLIIYTGELFEGILIHIDGTYSHTKGTTTKIFKYYLANLNLVDCCEEKVVEEAIGNAHDYNIENYDPFR